MVWYVLCVVGYEGGSLDKVLLQMAKAETIYLDRFVT